MSSLSQLWSSAASAMAEILLRVIDLKDIEHKYACSIQFEFRLGRFCPIKSLLHFFHTCRPIKLLLHFFTVFVQ